MVGLSNGTIKVYAPQDSEHEDSKQLPLLETASHNVGKNLEQLMALESFNLLMVIVEQYLCK